MLSKGPFKVRGKTFIPRLVQVAPFQNSKNDEDPSVDLVRVKMMK